MISHLVLTAVQSRILLALMVNGPLGSSSILRMVGISGSSWAKERKFLTSSGLLECRMCRELKEKGVVRKMEFALTGKGREISQNLLAISTSMSESVESSLGRTVVSAPRSLWQVS